MKNTLRSLWLLGLLAACAAFAGCTRTPAPPGAPPPPEVSVAAPVFKVVTDYEDFPGRIDAVNAIEVRARATGYLKKFLFEEGTDVKKGQPLFEIDDRPYVADQRKAKANFEQAKVRYDRLERDFQRAQGLLARKGISPEDYDKVVGDRAEAEAAVGVAQAQLDSADLMLKFTTVNADIDGRISRRLLDPGNMVQKDVTPLTTIVALDPVYAYFDLDERSTLKARRLVREGKVKWAPGQTLPVFMGLADEEGLCGLRVWVDPREVLARGVTLGDVVVALGKDPEVQVRTGVRGATDRAADVLLPMLGASGVGTLASPMGDGSLHAASAVAAGRTVELTLILPGRLAEPERFEQLVLKTASDGKATRLKDVAQVEHAPKNVGYPRHGQIEFADNRVDADTGTWRLRARFRNPDEALYPGLFVRIRLPVGTAYKALLVSQQALGTDQGQKFLYVLVAAKDKEGKAVHDKEGKPVYQVEYRRVKVGKLHDGLRVVLEGLKEDEKIVVSGLQRVRPGVEVRPQVVEMTVLADPTTPAGGNSKSEIRNPKQTPNPKSQ